MSTSNDTRPPSDAELMGYLDGELGEPRAAEVATHLEGDSVARDKIAGLELVGQLLREKAERDGRGDDIAAAVMARIDALPSVEAGRKTVQATREGAASDHSAADRGPAAEPEAQAPEGAKIIAWPERRARSGARDHARGLVGLALAAAAVAAGLFVWSRMPGQETAVAIAPSTTVEPATALSPAPPDTTPSAPGRAEAEPEEEPHAAVEVAAVDFGAYMGSVFYVSSGGGDAEATTAVIWVTDEAGGEGP